MDPREFITFVTQRQMDLDDLLKERPYLEPCIQMNQIHLNQVTIVDHDSEPFVPNTDAIITQSKGLTLVVRTADCLPVLIYHPSGVIAAVHAGRKGTEQKILKIVLEKMTTLTKSVDDFLIWFGPCICNACYQIDPVLDLHYDLVVHNLNQIKAVLNDTPFDFYPSNQCTACQNDLFYSYRKEGPKAGRIYSGIQIKKC